MKPSSLWDSFRGLDGDFMFYGEIGLISTLPLFTLWKGNWSLVYLSSSCQSHCLSLVFIRASLPDFIKLCQRLSLKIIQILIAAEIFVGSRQLNC